MLEMGRVEAIYKKDQQSNYNSVLSLLDKNEKADVVDLGCETGRFTMRVARKIGSKKIYGVDYCSKFIQLSRRNQVDVREANLNEFIPYDSGSFDVVIANQVIEHLSNTDEFLREIYRVLKKGGYTVVSTPNLAVWHNIYAIFKGYQLFSTSVSDEICLGNPHSPIYKMWFGDEYNDGHKRIFTHRGLKELFEYHGFQIDKIVGSGYYPFSGKLAEALCKIDVKHSQYLTVKARK